MKPHRILDSLCSIPSIPWTSIIIFLLWIRQRKERVKNKTGGSKTCLGILHLRNGFHRALGASRGCSPERVVRWCERSWRIRFYEIPAESPEIARNERRQHVGRSRNLVDAYQCSREFSLRIERSHAITLDSRVSRSAGNATDFFRAFLSHVRLLVLAREIVLFVPGRFPWEL